MEQKVIIRRNGDTICADPISETVRKGAYNSMNWQRYSNLIAAELKQQHDVTFELGSRFAIIKFEWRKWLYTSAETIHYHVMLLVKHCYSHNPFDMPTKVLVQFLNH